MVVKEIDGVQTMIASYWDGGYVLVDIEEPAAPSTSATPVRRHAIR